LPGVVGGICLLVGLFALQMLPVNYAGLALILLGITFFIAEAFVPSYGSLGVGGVIAFAIGAVMLIDTDVPGFGIPLALIAALAVVSGVFVFLIIVIAVLLFASFNVLREYERAVVFTLGRFTGVKGPGLIILVPVLQQMVRVDLRTVVLDIPPQDVITRDNVSVKVDAVVYFRVVDPAKSVVQVAKFLAATSYLAQTTLRAILGKHALDELLSDREKIGRAHV